MAERHELVQGDTRPRIIFTLTDVSSGLPIDVSAGGASVVLKFRPVGSTTLKDTLNCTKLIGLRVDNGDGTYSISTASPYDVPGAGGRVQVEWNPTTLDTAGDFEGELEITFGDASVQTVYDLIGFTVRSQF